MTVLNLGKKCRSYTHRFSVQRGIITDFPSCNDLAMLVCFEISAVTSMNTANVSKTERMAKTTKIRPTIKILNFTSKR